MHTDYIKPGTEQHRRLITASKIGAIFGLDQFTTPQKLWLQMTGQIPQDPINDAMIRGNIQEESILQWFFTVERPDLTQVGGETTWQNPAHPWCCANTDAHALDKEGHTLFVEAKSVARHTRTWGEPGTDQIPEKFWLQVQFQMWCADYFGGPGVTRCYVVKHGPYVDQYDVYTVDYQPQAAQQIADRAKAFWDSTQTPDAEPPAPIAQKDEHKWAARIHPQIEHNLHWDISRDLATGYIQATDAKKAAEAELGKIKAEILRVMGTARTAEYAGLTIAYRRPTRTGVSLYPPQRQITLTDIEQAEAATYAA